METIRYSKMDMDEIIRVLLNGGLIAFPTDTVFGLACIMDEKAMKKVYEAKGRDFRKPLPMMCDSLAMIREVAEVNQEAEKIIEKLMPGPLTLVFRKKDRVPAYVTQGLPTIGIRIPDDEWILELIGKLKTPLMVTSANVSGAGSLLSYEDVAGEMTGKIEGIVTEDAKGELASTIVDVSGDIRILRQGPITMEMIREVIR